MENQCANRGCVRSAVDRLRQGIERVAMMTRGLRARLLAAIVFVVVAVAGSVAIGSRQQSYVAVAELVVAPERIAGTSHSSAAGQVAAAVAVLRSRGFAREVAISMRLDRKPFAAVPGGWLTHQRESPDETARTARGSSEALSRAVDRLQGGLSVTPIDRTYLLRIAYSTDDPHIAAQVANRYADLLAQAPGSIAPAGDTAIRIISRADPPIEPYGPPTWLVLTAWVLAVAAATAGMVAIIRRRSAGLTSNADVQTRLGLPFLGSVPLLRSVLPQATAPLDAVVRSPMSGFTEAFRGIIVSASQIGSPGRRIVAVTSALPGEGKSTVTACLARTAALDGAKIVLVDCDTRQRAASSMLAPDARGPGLVEVLRGQHALEDALAQDPESGAWILKLTNGSEDPAAPALVADLAALFERLRSEFDLVLVDTAPIIAISSTRRLLPLADTTILVIGWRSTAIHAVKVALDLAEQSRGTIAGVVLNKVDLRRRSLLQRGDPNFYYNQLSKYYS